MNLRCRLKNMHMWLGVIAVALLGIGIDLTELTSWTILYDKLMALLNNPYRLGLVVYTLLCVFIDPTTKGIKDSELAKTYIKPKN